MPGGKVVMPKAYSNISTRQTVIELDTTILDRLVREVPRRSDGIINQVAKAVEGYAKTSMRYTGGGRTYRSGKGGGILHQASSPYQPPSTDTGQLENSIQTRKERPNIYFVDVGSEYGIYLEFGTSRMAPRPFLFPAVEKVEGLLPVVYLELFK